jgi:hypothetical protein
VLGRPDWGSSCVCVYGDGKCAQGDLKIGSGYPCCQIGCRSRGLYIKQRDEEEAKDEEEAGEGNLARVSFI